MHTCQGCGKEVLFRVVISHPHAAMPLEICTECFDTVCAESPVLAFVKSQREGAFAVQESVSVPDPIPVPEAGELEPPTIDGLPLGEWLVENGAEEPVLTGTNEMKETAPDDEGTSGDSDSRPGVVEEEA